jgi:hypothetical protein
MRPLHRPTTLRALRPARAVAVGFLTLALGACQMAEQSVNVNQSRIWTDYELHYDANKDLTTAKASFRFGSSLGTPLDLTSPSEVRFNGDLLARQVQIGTGFVSYERTFAGRVTSGTFRFVDTEDEGYSNTVTLDAVEFPASVGPIDNDNAYTFDWVGASLGSGEQVDVTLWRLAPGTASLAVFPQVQDGAHGVVMDALQLRNVAAGEVSLKMERRWSGTPSRAPDAGGRITKKWTAQDVVVDVID